MSKEEEYLKAMEKHERKEKLRKAKKKTQDKGRKEKPRPRDWTPGLDDWEAEILHEDERIMPRGSQEKRKQTAQVAENVRLHGDEPGDDLLEDPPEDTAHGRVVEVSANACRVQVSTEILNCSFRRVMLNTDSAFTNLAAVGDEVLVTLLEEDAGVVEAVLPRRSVLARARVADKQQIVAANIDRVLVVAAWRKPAIWPELIDRYLVAAERNHLEAVICVNKIDLVEDLSELEETIQPYRDVGYPALLTSAETGVGIPALREMLADSVTVLTGLSGVGKSSLLSQVQPGLALRVLTVGERGKNRDQGRHTTTMATLYPLADGGAVIDTPGVREFGLANLSRPELAGFYPEMAALMGGCNYGDCTHTHEPDCAVKAAVERGEVSGMRYENYVKILEGLPG